MLQCNVFAYRRFIISNKIAIYNKLLLPPVELQWLS